MAFHLFAFWLPILVGFWCGVVLRLLWRFLFRRHVTFVCGLECKMLELKEQLVSQTSGLARTPRGEARYPRSPVCSAARN